MTARAIEIDGHVLRPDRVAAAADVVRRGGLLAMPTDTTWVVACDAFDRAATKRLQQLRARMSSTDENKRADGGDRPMSLMCPDLAVVGTFVLLDQPQFRVIRRLLPGPYTIILPASRQVPRQLQSKRRAVGIRMPDHPVATAILAAIGTPVLVATCQTAGGELLGASPDVLDLFGDELDALVETLPIAPEPSTVVDWTGPNPRVVRLGRGVADPDWD